MAKNRLVRAGIAVVALLAVVGGVSFLIAAADSSDSTTVSAAASATESQAGSLSSSSAVQEVEELEEKPWLGVALALTPDGVTIAQVIADSPADAAGLQRGDVIEAVDGTEVGNVREFRDQLVDKNVGDTVTLTISGDGQVAVTLEAQPEALPRAIPLLPELEGIPSGEMFGHILGGQFNLTDEEGNPVAVVLEVGTVASVDADAGTLTVDLNAGGSKTYTVEDDDLICRGGGLSDLEEGDNVTVMTVGDDVRAVLPGGRMGFLPGLGGGMRGGMRGGGFGPGHGGFEARGDWGEGFDFGQSQFGNQGLWNGGGNGFSPPDAAPNAASGTGL